MQIGANLALSGVFRKWQLARKFWQFWHELLLMAAQQKEINLPEIILHLGAHKTATTTVQKTLLNNKAVLAENGVLTTKVGYLRENVTKNLINSKLPRAKRWPLARLLADDYEPTEIAAAQRVILSDENVIGYVDRIFEKGELYADTAERTALFAKWLPEPPKRILFSVRSYSGFFRSAYGQWIGLDNQFFSREIAQQKALEIRRGWHDIVADIQASFPHSEIIVTRYRRRAEFTQRQITALVGSVALLLAHDKKLFWNKGLDEADLAKMEAGLIDGSIDCAAIDVLRKQKIWGWPKNNSEFWDEDAQLFLNEKFRHDCAKITAMPGIQSEL